MSSITLFGGNDPYRLQQAGATLSDSGNDDETAATDTAKDATADKPAAGSVVLTAPPLTQDMQGVLLQDQSQGGTASVPSAAEIEAAYSIAQDIMNSADTNHNGSLSKSEIAKITPDANQAMDSLDTNQNGQVTVGELGQALLQGVITFSA